MTLLKKRTHAKLIVLLHNFKPHEARPGDAFLLWLLTRQPDGYLMLSESVKADLLAVHRIRYTTFSAMLLINMRHAAP
jgi:hypothetical protein